GRQRVGRLARPRGRHARQLPIVVRAARGGGSPFVTPPEECAVGGHLAKSCKVRFRTHRRNPLILHTYVRHANEGEFQLATPGTFVRDLGVGDLTGGELTAQVVRIEPEGAYIEELHRHDEGFSLAYVLKGWLDVEFEEIGVQHLGPGTVIPAYNGPR